MNCSLEKFVKYYKIANFVKRKLLTYKRYFLDYYDQLEKGAQEKLDYALMLLKTRNRISEKYLKHIGDGLYELRAEYKRNAYRIFLCFDKDNVVVLLSAFQKKTKKSPKAEIEKAKRIKREYDESKQ